MYQVSFGNRGTKFTAVLGGKMLRNLVVCYSITTELKLKCPTWTQLMSFLALRKTFCFESMFCRLETTKRTHTSVFALLSLLQGIARVKFYCFARQVCREISQATSSLLFRPRETRSSTRFSITAPRSSILDACEFQGSRIESRIETQKRLSTYIWAAL